MSEKNTSEEKFTAEELKKVKEIQQTYVDIQHKLGQISVARIRLEQQSNSLDERQGELENQFKETQTNEKDFISAITEKYGDGVLNPETGTYNKTEQS